MSPEFIDRASFEKLVRAEGDPLVSIYVPVDREAPGAPKAPITLRNLLALAKDALINGGMRPTKALELLAEAARLGDDSHVWDPPGDSIAVFVSPDRMRVFRLPNLVGERVDVGSHFCVLQLLPALEFASDFYALILDQARVRLMRFGPGIDEEEDLELEVSRSLEAFLAHSRADKGNQVHTAGRAGAAGTIIRHGSTDPGVDERARLRRYAHAIGRAVEARLPTPDAPIVLVGTREFQDAFRGTYVHDRLAEKGVFRSPAGMSNRKIRAAVYPLALRSNGTEHEVDLRRYQAVVGTGLTSCWLQEILAEAKAGRVETLLVSAGQAPATETDQLDETVRATLLGKGKVCVVRSDQLPEDVPAAAIFRY